MPPPTRPDAAERSALAALRRSAGEALREAGFELVELRGDPRGKVGERARFVDWLPSGELICGHGTLAGGERWSVFDSQTGRLLRQVPAGQRGDDEAFVHPSGLLCDVRDASLLAYDPQSGEPRRELRFQGAIYRAWPSASGRLVVALTRDDDKRRHVELREWEGGALRWRRPATRYDRLVLISEGLGQVLVPTRRGLRVLNLADGRELAARTEIPDLRTAALARGGELLVGVTPSPPRLFRWDLATGDPLGPPVALKAPRRVRTQALACNEAEALVALGGEIQRVSLQDGAITSSRSVAPYQVRCLALAPDGSALSATEGGAIQRWGPREPPSWPRTLHARAHQLRGPARGAPGELLFVAGRELAWVKAKGERRVLFTAPEILSWLRVSPRGDAALAVYGGGRTVWWSGDDLRAGATLASPHAGVLLDAQRALVETRSRIEPSARLVLSPRAGGARAAKQLRGRAFALGWRSERELALVAEEGLGRFDPEALTWIERKPLEREGLVAAFLDRAGHEVALVYQGEGGVRFERRRVADAALLETLREASARSIGSAALTPSGLAWISRDQLTLWRRGGAEVRVPLPAALGDPCALFPGPEGGIYVATRRGLIARLRLPAPR